MTAVATGPEYAGEKAVLIDMGSATRLKTSGLPWQQSAGLLVQYLHSSVFHSLSIDRADEFAYNWRVTDMFTLVRKFLHISNFTSYPKTCEQIQENVFPGNFPRRGILMK